VKDLATKKENNLPVRQFMEITGISLVSSLTYSSLYSLA